MRLRWQLRIVHRPICYINNLRKNVTPYSTNKSIGTTSVVPPIKWKPLRNSLHPPTAKTLKNPAANAKALKRRTPLSANAVQTRKPKSPAIYEDLQPLSKASLNSNIASLKPKNGPSTSRPIVRLSDLSWPMSPNPGIRWRLK